MDPKSPWLEMLANGETTPDVAAVWLALERETANCFPILKARLSEDNRRVLANTPMQMLAMYHYGLGTWIRNNLLKPESMLYLLFQDAGFDQKDDMSMFVIEKFHAFLQRDTGEGG